MCKHDLKLPREGKEGETNKHLHKQAPTPLFETTLNIGSSNDHYSQQQRQHKQQPGD